MPDIRYVCLSDMHLGAENSLLTNLTPDCQDTDPMVASPVLAHLVECLREAVGNNENKEEKPTLILDGDILELALANDNEAAMAFERFIELIFPAGGERLFKKIKYIPGNHDHHLWETAREVQYVQYISNSAAQRPGSELEVPWHATKMFDPDPVPSLFLNGIVRRYPHLRDENIDTVYPNYAFVKEERRCAIFTHGHFIESLYRLMSTLRCLVFPEAQEPVLAWDIEAQNFAWVDFFWSTLGRSGEVGADVELVYDRLQNPPAFEQLVDNLATALTNKFNFWMPFKRWFVKRLVHFLLFNVAHMERSEPSVVMSDEAQQGLKAYLEGPVLKQIKIERSDNIPRHLNFVFGHTHKPYEEDRTYDGYHPNVNVFNTGGWVVDTPAPQPTHGGAVVLLDENLHAVSLRMYNEAKTRADYAVRVQTATHPGDEPNLFYQRMSELVDPQKHPWRTFSDVVCAAVPMRERNLQWHIDRQG